MKFSLKLVGGYSQSPARTIFVRMFIYLFKYFTECILHEIYESKFLKLSHVTVRNSQYAVQ